MADRKSTASRHFRWLLVASALSLVFPAAAPALVKLPTRPGGGGIGGVFEPGDGGGGGGGGISHTSAYLEAHGYVCRPFNNGIQYGKRCDTTFIEPTAFTATLEVQRCDPNDSCTRRATKTSRGKVGDKLSLWSFDFPAAAKASGYGDVDGDGDDDVIAFWDLHATGGQVRVGRSNGTNEFSQAPQLWASSFCASMTQECGVGDFSGDHKADIASFDRTTGQVSVATSNGSAFVGPRVWNQTFGSFGGRILVGDFDGDGADDVAAILPVNSTAGARGTVLVSRSRPGPPVAQQSTQAMQSAAPAALPIASATASMATFSTAATTPHTATLGTATANAATLGTTTAVFPGGPIGGIGGPRIFLAPVAWIGPLCPDPTECVVGDYDGDGKDDIARVRSTGESYVARSTGSAFLGEVNWSDRLGRDPRAFRSADMNADGKDDLVAIRGDGGLTVGISNGSFFVANVEVDDMSCGDPQLGCQFANLDGDAHPDLVEIYPFGDSYLRPGDTFVSKGAEPRGFPADPERPAPPDGDGDGVRDTADDCIYVANATQTDGDGNGIGDACELRADLNGDGIVDLSDRFILLLHLGQNFPAADVNGDGTVNQVDLAILDQERLAPEPSATTGPPQLELVAPRNGTFYEKSTRRVYVAGFVRNVSSQNGSIAVRSQTYPGQAVTTSLPIAVDGWFEGFVPVDNQKELNAIVVEAKRTSTGAKSLARAVAQLGTSAAPGDYSPSSLGARIQAWELSELAEQARQGVNLGAIADEAEGGEVRGVTITGPMSLTVRPFSDQIAIDIGLPAMHVDYEDFLTGCNVPLSIGGIRAHIEYDLEPRYLYPAQVAAKDLPGSPNVTFQSFSSGEHLGCAILATVSDTDMRAKAEEAFEVALMARDFGEGPVDGAIEGQINAINLSQALTDLDVVLGTRFRSVPEDVIGVSFDLDSGFAAESTCGTELCHPPLTNATARAFQTGAPHPSFPLLVPNGGLYDVALALAPDTINQLFAGMMEGGKLASLLAGRPFDLTEYAVTLAGVNLQPTLKFVPTLAPFLTGRPGTNGGTEVQIGQLLLEIPSVDNTDVFRVAVDLKGSVDFAIVPKNELMPLPPTVLAIRLHDLEVLSAEVVHVPATTDPFFGNLFKILFLPQVELQTLSIRYPLPKFGDLGLTLLGLDANPSGGAVVFGQLDPSGSTGPVLEGGVFAQP